MPGPYNVYCDESCHLEKDRKPVMVLGAPLRSLTEVLQIAKDNGALRALTPIENKRTFLDVPVDVVEYVDPVLYGDPKTAAMKALGLT